MLRDHERKHGLTLWRDWVCCFNGLVTIKEGDVEGGLAIVDAALEKVGDAKFLPRYTALLGEFAASLGHAGCVTRGLETIEALIARLNGREEYWYVPEALRIKGELAVQKGDSNAVAIAEVLFIEAIALARRQASRSWESRAAASLARLKGGDGTYSQTLSQVPELL
jgi:hypothetical protein